MALFLSKSLSETLIKAPFMLFFNLVISCISVNEKPFKEVLADVPLVPDQLTMYGLYKSFILQRLTVINISRRYHKVEKLSFLIANQVQFETEEPTHRASSSLSYAFENFVNMYSLVFADAQWCAVNEAYTRAFP